MSKTKSVLLTPEQISFLGESLDYSAQRFRDYDYSGQDRDWVAEHKREKEELIASIRQAFRSAEPS